MRQKRFKHVGVQSRLIALVLTASLATMLLTGLVGFSVARHLLAEAGYERLAAMGSNQAMAVNEFLEELRDHVMTLSEANLTVEAAKAFSETFSQLPDITDKQKKELRDFYTIDFIPKLKRRSLSNTNVDTYLPEKASERYLKYHYVAANNASHLDTTRLEDARDGSAWSRVHREYHSRLLRLAKLFDYQDIMLVDSRTGTVVYNTSKEDDLGTNLLSGPYADSPAAKVFRKVRSSRDPFFLTISDFANYTPSFGKPTMFVGTTVFDGDRLIAVLIIQLNNDHIDRLMTANRNWQSVGMGRSGETYLVGEDGRFRSSPRFFLEHPGGYLESERQRGLAKEKVEAISKTGTPVLMQSVNTSGARHALAGRSGMASFRDYRGVPVVSAYQPIQFGPFEWALLAEIDQAELFSGIGQLGRNLLLLAALLIPAMTFLTLKLAQAFIQPIRRLLEATEQISSGDYAIRIPVTADDEFGDLAIAFNTMSDRLTEREASLTAQVGANQRLLRSIMPGGTASRLPVGNQALAETHPDVSVLVADIAGWNEASQSLPTQESVRLLRELRNALDGCVERSGLDKLQDAGTSTLAVAGLSHPRDDHQRRAVDCALAMVEQLQLFNHAHDFSLALEIGVHAGPLATGVVRGDRVSFDIWGPTISIARAIQPSSGRNAILITAPIQEALGGLHSVRALPPISVKGQGVMALWEVTATTTHP